MQKIDIPKGSDVSRFICECCGERFERFDEFDRHAWGHLPKVAETTAPVPLRSEVINAKLKRSRAAAIALSPKARVEREVTKAKAWLASEEGQAYLDRQAPGV